MCSPKSPFNQCCKHQTKQNKETQLQWRPSSEIVLRAKHMHPHTGNEQNKLFYGTFLLLLLCTCLRFASCFTFYYGSTNIFSLSLQWYTDVVLSLLLHALWCILIISQTEPLSLLCVRSVKKQQTGTVDLNKTQLSMKSPKMKVICCSICAPTKFLKYRNSV